MKQYTLSKYIEYPEALRLIEAGEKARLSGVPWNKFVTINFEQAGIPAKKIRATFRTGLNQLRQKIHEHCTTFTCGWVFENSPTVGVHIHILLHIPKHWEQHYQKFSWALSKCFFKKRQKGIIQMKKFYHFSSYHKNYQALLSYLLKDTNPLALPHLNSHSPVQLLTESYNAIYGRLEGKRIGDNYIAIEKPLKPLCGAKTRKGRPCKAKALKNGRCKLHGGLSTGPKTISGKERAKEALKKSRATRKDRK